MKNKILYTLLVALFAQCAYAQIECNNDIVVELDENGSAEVAFQSLVPNIEFLLASGEVAYLILPNEYGEITSGDQTVTLECDDLGGMFFIVEHTVNGEFSSNCSGEIDVISPNGGCPTNSICEDESDCLRVYQRSSLGVDPEEILADDFAVCSDFNACPGVYKVAKGVVADAENLMFGASIVITNADDYYTPVVVEYTHDGAVQYRQTAVYVWANAGCLFSTVNTLNVSLDASGNATLNPSMFLQNATNCDDLSLAIQRPGDPTPWQYASTIDVTCDEAGVSTIWVKNEETNQVATCTMFLSDPLDACGFVLGDDEALITVSPQGSTLTLDLKVFLNDELVEYNPLGGYLIKEEDLIEGGNTIRFESGEFTIAGVSTLDLVLAQRLIVMDTYDYPMQPIVFDIDESGHLGLFDLIRIRELILGIEVGEDYNNYLFRNLGFEFPSNFDPFDFDYDFTKFEFDSADFSTTNFDFKSYKVGDFNTADNLKEEDGSSTRDVGVFKVSDLDVEVGQEFVFELTYTSDLAMKGLLTGIVSDGIDFESILAAPSESVVENIIHSNEMRISYINSELEDVYEITFFVEAKATKSGALEDLLALKSGFPQEVLDENDEIVLIEDIEPETMVSSSDLEETVVSVYPNPTQNLVYVSVNSKEIGHVRIFDVTGALKTESFSNETSIMVDVSEYKDGLYYVLMDNGQSLTFVKSK